MSDQTLASQPNSNQPNDSVFEAQLTGTYYWLRVGIAATALVLPVLLWLGGLSLGVPLQSSISAYYWANPALPTPCACLTFRVGQEVRSICPSQATCDKMHAADCFALPFAPAGTLRSVFVGFLFAVGAMLFVYKGYTKREDYALNLAGLLIIGVAVTPMRWSCAKVHTVVDPHGTFAISFFIALAYVSAFCSRATLPLITNPDIRNRYSRRYHTLAWLMVLSPIAAYALNLLIQANAFIFLAETLGIYAFAAYWIVKMREVKVIGSEKIARENADEERVKIHLIKPRFGGARGYGKREIR